MRNLFTLFLVFASFQALAQKDLAKEAAAIENEGKKLYRSEMASWYGSDVFSARYADLEKVGGYFSYQDNGLARCVFYSKDTLPRVIGTISFDGTFDVRSAAADMTERAFSSAENAIYRLREKARTIIGTDTFFRQYSHTNFNLVPFIDGEERQVYVMTATGESGNVLLGNDYLLTFDTHNTLTGKKRFHNSIIPFEYGQAAGGSDSIGAIHSHLPELGQFMSATDICTLMLYAKLTGWKRHVVVSQDYISLWNCEQEKLVILPAEAFRKKAGSKQ